MPWQLHCCLCSAYETNDLALMQAHALAQHQLIEAELEASERAGPLYFKSAYADVMYLWNLPDGRLWLRAVGRQEEENHATQNTREFTSDAARR